MEVFVVVWYMSHATPVSPKLSFGAPWRVGDTCRQKKSWIDNIKDWTSLPMP